MAKAGKKEGAKRQPASQNSAEGRSARAPAKGRAPKGSGAVVTVEAVEVRAGAVPDPGAGELARHLRDALADVSALRAELRAVREETAAVLSALKGDVAAAATEVAELRRLCAQAGAKPGETDTTGAGAEDRPAAPEAEARKNRFGVTVAAGVVVAEVVAGSPAEAAGLIRGDVIEEANGSVVHNGADLRELADRVAAGEDLTLHLRRGGELVVRTVRLGAGSTEGGSRFGVTVAPGVVIAEVFADSPAEAAGLARGDVIEDAHGQAVHSGEQLLSIVHAQPEGADVALVVTRGGERREVVAHLDRG